MPHVPRPVHWLGLLALAALGAAAPGCGSSSSQADARDSATSASCAWLQMCGQIGAGKAYVSLDDCQVRVRAQWDMAWDPTACDGKINPTALQMCLTAIQNTECDSGADVAATLVIKCPQSKVCSGANPDGG